MNKKSAFFFIIILFLMIFSFGCSKSNNSSSEIPQSSTSPEPSESSDPLPSSEPVSSEPIGSSEPINKFISPTTGNVFEIEHDFYPIMVTIENASGARPQTGLNQADIIYEFPVESTITRFLCIYNDNLPKVVGPVRSARYYFLYCQKEWDCIYEHFGGAMEKFDPINVYNSKYNWIRVNIDGLLGKYSSFYWRDNSRQAPHNVYSDLTYVKEKYPDFVSSRSYFWPHSDQPSSSEISAKKIHIPYASKKKPNVEFYFDEATGLYTRRENGEIFKSVETNSTGNTVQEPVTTNNIIVQYVPMDTLHTTSYYRRIINMVGTGKAEFFINGKYISGKWERKTDKDVTQYFDDQGNEIALSVGKTWVAIQPTGYQVTFE